METLLQIIANLNLFQDIFALVLLNMIINCALSGYVDKATNTNAFDYYLTPTQYMIITCFGWIILIFFKKRAIYHREQEYLENELGYYKRFDLKPKDSHYILLERRYKLNKIQMRIRNKKFRILNKIFKIC